MALSVSLQSDWDNHNVIIKVLLETVTRGVQHYYVFHEQASLKVQGIKGSTSQTQGQDGTLSATTVNSVKMILEGLTRLRTV